MAKNHLKSTWKRIQNLKIQTPTCEIEDCDMDTNVDTFNAAEIDDELMSNEQQQKNTDDDDFEIFLKRSKMSTSKPPTTTKRDINLILNEFDNIDTIPHTANILTYWQNNKTNFKELYELSEIINAIPVTQVSFLNIKCIKYMY